MKFSQFTSSFKLYLNSLLLTQFISKLLLYLFELQGTQAVKSNEKKSQRRKIEEREKREVKLLLRRRRRPPLSLPVCVVGFAQLKFKQTDRNTKKKKTEQKRLMKMKEKGKKE
jgi:hypothetical protein